MSFEAIVDNGRHTMHDGHPMITIAHHEPELSKQKLLINSLANYKIQGKMTTAKRLQIKKMLQKVSILLSFTN